MNKKIFLLLTLSINLSYKIHAQEKNSPKYFYTKTEKEQIYKQSRQAALQEVKDLAEAIIIIPPVLGSPLAPTVIQFGALYPAS